jgi:ferredoxin
MAEAALNLEEYFVTEDCIACDACCNDFPDIFTMNADHTRAIAVKTSPVGKFNPWDIINDCPVDAIKLVNMPMPPMPEGMKKKKEEPAAPSADLGNWMERWVAVRDELEPQWERMKRYGTAASVEDAGDRYVLRFDMPEKVPNHKYKFKWGLPEKMPDYQYSVETKGVKAKVRAVLTDPQILKLCGWVNSFPDGFLREYQFAVPLKGHKENYDPETRVLEVTLEKDLSAAPAA